MFQTKKSKIIVVVFGVFILFLIDSLGNHLFTDIENRGFSFGLAEGSSTVFIVVLDMVIFLTVLWHYLKEKERQIITGLYLFLVGGGVNLIHRVLNGSVSDYIGYFGIIYGNIADIFVLLGLGIISYFIVFDGTRKD